MSQSHVQLERLLEVGRYAEARELLAGVLAQQPDDPDLRVVAARIAIGEDDPSEGRLQLQEALARQPGHFLARYLLFQLNFAEKEYAEAEQLIIGLIRDYPQHGDLLASYADLMLHTLHIEKARSLTDEALRLDPESESARLTDVMLSTVEGRGDRAGLQLSQLIANDPSGQAVAGALMLSLIDQKRPKEALEVAQELLRVQPDNTDLVELIIDLRAATHPMALPLWPLRRFGWAASAGLWLGAILVLNLVRSSQSPIAAPLGSVYLLWVIYSWVYTPVMTRWLRRRGI